MDAQLRGLIAPALLSLVVFAVLIALGNWQMRRLDWKETLIERVAERPNAPPVDLRRETRDIAADNSFFDQFEYRTALLDGRYDAGAEVRVFTSLSEANGPFGGPGYWVLTPFVTPDGALVYVNRGFVPEDRKHSYGEPPEGNVTISGLIRAPETGSWFTPEHDPGERLFFARDPRRIAEAMRLSGPVAGFYLDLVVDESPGGLPQAGETRMVFTNNHLAYAVTWYGLAAALLAVFASFVWSGWRDGPPRLTQPGHDP